LYAWDKCSKKQGKSGSGWLWGNQAAIGPRPRWRGEKLSARQAIAVSSLHALIAKHILKNNPRREYSLREVFNVLRYQAATDKGIHLNVVKLPEARARLCALATAPDD
jgi:hypothetical protein